MASLEPEIRPSARDNYTQQRLWSDRFIPEIQRIIEHRTGNRYQTMVATEELDCKAATDLVMLGCMERGVEKRIACRVRTHGYSYRYPCQFTIRYPTEFDKILSGCADYMFYGHQGTEGSADIHPWWILDLDVFRQRVREVQSSGAMTINLYPTKNGDGTQFIAFKLWQFPDDLVLCSD